ncbi:MAG: transcription termination/antitermination factor NusG [Clostridia bacterium]|nr:transcription termination/antitermination factor NusG [Clostridia bacterium]
MQVAPKWYVIHVYSSYEFMVKNYLENMIENNNLQDYIFEISIPVREEIVERNGKRKVVEKKRYPGYVFIKMIHTQEVGYLVINTRGVTGFCGPSGKPLALTDEEIKRMGLEKRDVASLDIQEGDLIRVISGAFESNLGTIDKIYADKQKVKVIMQLFGRETPVELEFNQVEKVNADN